MTSKKRLPPERIVAVNPYRCSICDVIPKEVLVHRFLPMFDTFTAKTLRKLNKYIKTAVTLCRWRDLDTCILHLKLWRTCFPNATGACLSKNIVMNSEFEHLAGIQHLVMAGCMDISNIGFIHLSGIESLDMSDCYQESITDEAFTHLRGIKSLDMSGCHQKGITDMAFSNLRGINTLRMSRCAQETITDQAFQYLEGIQELRIRNCERLFISNKASSYLKGIKILDLGYCSQAVITDTLDITYVNHFTDAAFNHLGGIHTMKMKYCFQCGIDDVAHKHLTRIHTLSMIGCTQRCIITDLAFAHLTGIHTLNITPRDQLTCASLSFPSLSALLHAAPQQLAVAAWLAGSGSSLARSS